MNLIRIVKLLWRNIYLIIAVPVILALIVRYLTKDEILKYESETTLFTGLASGQSLDQTQKSFSIFAANNAFDNLLNLIRSREVASETGIRLVVQHLMLDKADPTIIDPYNYKWVHQFIPDNIKQLIVRSKPNHSQLADSAMAKTTATGDTVFLTNGDIVFKNRLFHFVGKNEDIQIIAKNYGISVASLLNLNSLTSSSVAEGYPLIVKDDSEEGSDNSNLYDPNQVLSTPTVQKLSDYEATVEKFIEYAAKDDTNYLFRLLNSKNPYYSIGAISSVTAKRVQNSDMVTIKYSSFDPGICQHTLIFMTEVVIKKFRSIKANESDAVVKYFLNEVNRTAKRLQNAEDRLLRFNEQNSIINYYEQSKAVAVEKEDLDVAYQNEQVKFAAAAAVLKRLEDRMGLQQTLQLKTSSILALRDKLSEVTTQITMTESFNDPDPKNRKKLNDLKLEAEKIKKELNDKVSDLFISNTTVEGVPVENVLSSWLDNVIAYEQSRASMKILANRVQEFYEYYKTFAPLGATQKRLEREISVAEQEYLSLLHSLSESKLAQQNVELSSDIKAVDPPFLPLSPIPGKAGLLVVAAAIAGFFLVIFVIIMLEFLDTTIRTPEILEELSKLKVITAFPRIISQYSNYNLRYITTRLVDQIANEIRLSSGESNTFSGPKIVLLASAMPKEGKTFLLSLLSKSFRDYGDKVLALTPYAESKEEKNTKKTSKGGSLLNKTLGKIIPIKETGLLSDIAAEDLPVAYKVDNKFYEANSFSDINIAGDTTPDYYSYSYLLFELPAIISKPYPRTLAAKANVTIWITRSTRSWRKADTYSLNAFSRNLKNKPVSVLNGVEIDIIEDFLGELPKRRTRIRRIIKKIFSLQLHERNSIGE